MLFYNTGWDFSTWQIWVFDRLLLWLSRKQYCFQDYDRKGLGGIFLEDIQESLPRCDKVISRLEDDDRILVINAADKKKVVFLRDNAEKLQVFIPMICIKRIDEYLNKLFDTLD